MRVYILYDPNEIGVESEKKGSLSKLKINVPQSWLEFPCKKLLSFFLDTVRKDGKHDTDVDTLEIKCGGLILKSTDIIGKHIHEYNELLIARRKVSLREDINNGNLRCTNYGCGKLFNPEDNTDTSCHFHLKGPVFHDLEKHWSCCPGKKAFDWEEFQQLPTCQVGKHSTANKPFAISEQAITNVPLSSSQMSVCSTVDEQSVIMQRTTGPREFEGAKVKSHEIVDGKARCRNHGCNKEFLVESNNESACVYHKEGPVIWDTQKYWKCCPHSKCYEFEDFLQVRGCCIGPHQS